MVRRFSRTMFARMYLCLKSDADRAASKCLERKTICVFKHPANSDCDNLTERKRSLLKAFCLAAPGNDCSQNITRADHTSYNSKKSKNYIAGILGIVGQRLNSDRLNRSHLGPTNINRVCELVDVASKNRHHSMIKH
uniref:Uncharacterized protein n=1 Tax=Spongospora subterranea TaxID=70186 RepID=A0A0H5QRJ7_9EUKA|eukprot:CRZ04653.1 hypothetical protein [Spongospora subterranea]